VGFDVPPTDAVSAKAVGVNASLLLDDASCRARLMSINDISAAVSKHARQRLKTPASEIARWSEPRPPEPAVHCRAFDVQTPVARCC